MGIISNIFIKALTSDDLDWNTHKSFARFRGSAKALAQDHPVLLLWRHCCLQASVGIHSILYWLHKELISQSAMSPVQFLGINAAQHCLKYCPCITACEPIRTHRALSRAMSNDWSGVSTLRLGPVLNQIWRDLCRHSDSADRAAVVLLSSILHNDHAHVESDEMKKMGTRS